MIASGQQIREVNGLIKRFLKANGEKTHPSDWKKMRGNATIHFKDTGTELLSEVHWYECPNVGKVKFKTVSGPEVKKE